ncbi:hypothetical protein Cgig2_002199 [Carnegiea gigantea]|uniref:Glucan endo-1,3-beta-D-glucosidase n=1 Tax=Carnegiea gigantea TaxID=171969 RepID=A0A9Q1KVK7_9CARY|nr:hypothetical protein Cgig2_002199 [Carnegiea gigantea]
MAVILLTVIVVLLPLAAVTSAVPSIGVTYRHPSAARASPEEVAATVQRLKISSVLLPNPDPNLIRAFSYSDVSLLLSIPNSHIPILAANRSNAAAWLYTHVVPFYPRAHISAISVGSDVLSTASDLSDSVLPAIRNIHVALHELGIRKISVSTTFSLLNTLTTAFPPSAAEFQPPVHDVLVENLLDFLQEANSSFLINLQLYDLYRLDHEIPIGFALFQEGLFNFRDDLTTGVRYRNLFDTMVDALLSAMAVAGHENIPIIVTETGWPGSLNSEGGVDEPTDACQVFAEMFLSGLVKHLKSGIGTPLKRDGVSEVYIFELFDGEMNQSRNGQVLQWGILYPNLTKKYKFDFSGSSGGYGFPMDAWLVLLLAFGHGIVLMFGLLLTPATAPAVRRGDTESTVWWDRVWARRRSCRWDGVAQGGGSQCCGARQRLGGRLVSERPCLDW